MSLRLDCCAAGAAFGQRECSQLKSTKIKKSVIKVFAQWSCPNTHRTLDFGDQQRVSNTSPLKMSLMKSFVFDYLCRTSFWLCSNDDYIHLYPLFSDCWISRGNGDSFIYLNRTKDSFVSKQWPIVFRKLCKHIYCLMVCVKMLQNYVIDVTGQIIDFNYQTLLDIFAISGFVAY